MEIKPIIYWHLFYDDTPWVRISQITPLLGKKSWVYLFVHHHIYDLWVIRQIFGFGPKNFNGFVQHFKLVFQDYFNQGIAHWLSIDEQYIRQWMIRIHEIILNPRNKPIYQNTALDFLLLRYSKCIVAINLWTTVVGGPSKWNSVTPFAFGGCDRAIGEIFIFEVRDVVFDDPRNSSSLTTHLNGYFRSYWQYILGFN